MEEKLLEAFNKQINLEFSSAYLYFAMSTYFCEIMMDGFAELMRKKAKEKLTCAQKIYDYLILRDEKLSFSRIEEPSNDWINVSDIFSTSLSHEEFILTNIKELYKTARDVDDIAAMEFISSILDKQIKITGYFRKLVFRVKNANLVSSNVEFINYECLKDEVSMV